MKNIAIVASMLLTVSACSAIPSKQTANNDAIANKPSECIAEQATKLIGQNDLSEAQIKQLTQANTVRKVSPNQPVTMDYRFDRVTVTVDPATKKIIQASCG